MKTGAKAGGYIQTMLLHQRRQQTCYCIWVINCIISFIMT